MSNYISNSYGLKYIAETKNYRGLYVRLAIYQKNYVHDPFYIGAFCGVWLEIQGSQDAPYAPIVKTQLRFSMVDAVDEPDTNDTKYGYWQEFFTPDSTKYYVELLTSTDGSNYTARWRGYITPDSWQESLEYRGIITVTARDNIGHLQDFDFDMTPDAYGLVSVGDLIDQALTLVEFPMDVTQAISHLDIGQSTFRDLCFNASIFEGENWYTALEKVLESLGLTFRFNDYAAFLLTPIRKMPLHGYTDERYLPQVQDLEFYGSGTRTLSPGCKQIIDKTDYGYEQTVELDVMKGVNLPDDSYTSVDFTFNSVTHTGPVYTNNGDSDYVGWQVGSSMYNPALAVLTQTLQNAEGKESIISGAPIIPVNVKDSGRYAAYEFPAESPNITLRMTFGNAVEVKELISYYSHKLGLLRDAINTFKVAISYTYNGTAYYWTGADWSTTAQYVSRDMSGGSVGSFAVEFQLNEPDDVGPGTFRIVIDCHGTKVSGSDSPAKGSYIRMTKLEISSNAQPLESDTVTTVNNNAYNVTIKRDPELGMLSKTVNIIRPEVYKNAFFYYSSSKPYQADYEAEWQDLAVYQPFPAIIAKQILMFYHTPLEILNGDCAPANKEGLRFDAIYSYKGVQLMIQSGTWDLLTGVLQGATLRAFAWYEDLWDS